MEVREAKLRPGDFVEVRTPDEIAGTLDANGTVEHLPFMREMVEYCGKRFRVLRRVVKVCASGMKGGSVLRGFATDDVVLLEGTRCSGADHDGCQKLCVIFWREAWLRKVNEGDSPAAVAEEQRERFRAKLKTIAAHNIYFCQASELLRATKSLSKRERYTSWVRDLQAGNTSVLEVVRGMGIFVYWKIYRRLFGPYGRTSLKTTPTEALGLRAGELVQVKPMDSIRPTLDGTANNRGLWFSPNMLKYCGKQQKVERRIEKLIVDGTGEMRHMKNTVFLEGSHCGCPYIAFGGCSRCEYVYWREIWLQRV
jgi:hypothetical protein